jgi:hypothetical protein
MLTLNDAQCQALWTAEARQFVTGVCDDFLNRHPEMRREPGRDTVLVRMQTAYDYAASTGFSSTPHIVRLMWLATDAPVILGNPLLKTYLRKPGATPEQRLDDLDAVINNKLAKESRWQL